MLTHEQLYWAGPTLEPSERLVSFALERGGGTIVDVGCGYGVYASRLKREGRQVVGVDRDPRFVEETAGRGIEAVEADAASMPFEDGQFDTAILFEVLEHIPEPERVLKEALRVTRRNVLVTVPNVGEYEALKAYGLTYWHLAVTDHVNFFTPEGLRDLGVRCGARAEVTATEPLEPFGLVRQRRAGWLALVGLRRLGLLRPVAFQRLYGVFEKPAV